jgi:glucosylceramidase
VGRPIQLPLVTRDRVELAVLGGLVGILAVIAGASVRPGTGATQDRGLDGPAAVLTDAVLTGPGIEAAVTTPFNDGGRWATVDVGGADAGDPADLVLTVTRPAVGRTWRGVGAALTDASVELLSGHDDALASLFDPSVPGGASLDLVRLPLSATDFSIRSWTWSIDASTGSGVVEPTPEALAALAVLDEITALRPDVSVIGAAWTAPASMRTNPTSPGGRLVDSTAYGELLIGQVDWLLANGVPLTAVSLGNEPGFVGDSPTLGMTDDQLVELSADLHGDLDRVGVELLALDHNWSDVDRAVELVERGSFDSVAFHCYDGDPSEMARVEAPVLVTECTATTGGWHESVGWMARELVGDAVRSGSTGLLMWNLALDPAHGPKRAGGCDDCRGLLTIDPADGSVVSTPELSVLAHLSAVADPGAAILDVDLVDRLPLAAFENPDGSIGVFGHNDRPDPMTLDIDLDDERRVRIEVPSWAIFSLRSS